jgi:cell division protease FtsH
MDSKKKTTNSPKLSWYWWLIVIGLAIWDFWVLLPKSQPEISIPYSSFLGQVNGGNVTQVKITGNNITGVFKSQVNSAQLLPGTTSPGSTKPTGSYTQFQTNFPDTIGDPELIPLLNQHNVEIDVSQPPIPWFTILLTDGLPFILLIIVLFWMGRQASRNQSGIFTFGRSKAREYNIDHPTVTFNDVSGADEAKNDLREIVDFLREPQKYHKIGAHIPRGVLLVGPPGTGKTLMARAIAGEAHVPFFSISASEFVEMFVGVGASRVRDLFEKAKASAPAIVFIDELDAVGRRRGAGVGNTNDEREQTLNQLLVEMDGFDEHHELIVLAATNRPDVLDPALLRPGRFDRQITVGLPDRQGREGILRIHTRGLKLSPEVDLGVLARTTTGFSGADLANLSNEAALVAARENHEQVTMADFEEALDKILLGATRKLILSDQDRRTVAYHEAGHAVIAWYSPLADQVHKVTIVPRGRALGVTEQLPGDDHYNYSREYLFSRIGVMLGGRAAEEVALEDITTGAENDLIEATRLARRMVTRWGMSSISPMVVTSDEEQPFLGYELTQVRDVSEATMAQIDHDVQKILNERYNTVRKMLESYRSKLDSLVDVLLKEETVNQDTLEEILGKRMVEEEDLTHPAQDIISG